MRTVAVGTFVFMCGISSSSAQRIEFFGDFETLDVVGFAQCELGLWSRTVRLPLPPGREIALVSAEGTEIKTFNANAKGNWFVYGEASYKTENSIIAKVSRPRNINPANRGACINNRPALGILECLTKNAKQYPGDDIVCTGKVFATASATFGGKFNLWVVGAEATGTLASTRGYTVVVTLPKPGH